MSKDKGTKNHKKAPADKSAGKTKALSAYKSEGKNGQAIQISPEAFVPKTDHKKGGSNKA